ncbi:MAG: hypothetical protein Roseis2KO_01190 [Roseivirga sp.]
MAEENDIALIESYLQGELDAEKKNEVEQRLAHEPDFKLLFEDTQLMIQGLSKLRHKHVLNRIDELETGLSNPLESKKETRVVYWTVQRIAAVFIGLAVVAITSWYIVRGDGSISGPALYENYQRVYPNVVVPTTRGEDDLTLLTRTFRAYDQALYDSAAILFEELLLEDKREFVRLYAGLTYIEIDENDRAQFLLTTIISEKGEYEIQATWYLALNYIKTEDYDNAKSLLMDLTSTSTTYQEKARELLKKMR